MGGLILEGGDQAEPLLMFSLICSLKARNLQFERKLHERVGCLCLTVTYE